MNLKNLLNVINLIHFLCNGNFNDFISFLSRLKIIFSYVKRDSYSNVIDLVLLTPNSMALYNYISTQGESGFEDENLKSLAKNFCLDVEKFKFDIGYTYEDLTSMHLLEFIGDDNYDKFPTVMYYIKNNDKILNNKIITLPELYYTSKIGISGKLGFNEIDLCIRMKKTVFFKENYNLCEIDDNKKLIQDNELVLKEDCTYLFEIKKKIEYIIPIITHINSVLDRFVESFKNNKINNFKQYNIQEYRKILICDQNINDAKEEMH